MKHCSFLRNIYCVLRSLSTISSVDPACFERCINLYGQHLNSHHCIFWQKNVVALKMESGSITCSKRSVVSNWIIHTAGMKDSILAICMYLLLSHFSIFTSRQARFNGTCFLSIHFYIYTMHAVHVFKVRINMTYA